MKYLSFFICAAAFLNANPKNHSVVSGEAKVSHEGNLMEINVSDRAILNWEEFSIQAGETTRFIQSSQNAAVLNRVTGAQMSEILGSLQAGGHVYLINPNGVVIGPEGIIDTAGFISSIYEIQNVDFLNGEPIKFQGDELGEIINLGTITTTTGPVALIAHRVENSGTITSAEGIVSLNSGHEILLDPTGQGLLFIRPDIKGAGVENNGTIEAYKTQLQADGTPTSLAIGLGGVIDASSVQNIGGEIYLVAKEGSINVSGQLIGDKIVLHSEKELLEMSGEIKAPGGEVRLLGEKVHLLENARIDVSEETRGGTVLIGGDYQGLNPEIPNSKAVYLAKNVEIHADAIETGDGGKVILWGDLSNGFFGQISAKGGKEGGDGGFVEISSKGGLAFHGLVSTLAPNGKSGMLLLDPTDVTIATGGDVDCTPGATYMWTGPAVNVDTPNLYANLALGDVFVLTSSAVDQGQLGALTVNTPLNLTGPNALFLFSNSDMNINSDITCSGAGNLNMFATGNLNINSTINWSSSNPFSCNSTVDTNINGNIICTSGVNLTVAAMGNLFVRGTVSTNGAGVLSLSAFGGGSELGLFSGCVLQSQTAITLSPNFFLDLSGTVTINTPQAVTLTSATQLPVVRGIPCILNTTSSSLSFPNGASSGGPGQDLTINATNGDVIMGGPFNFSALSVTAAGNIDVQGVLVDITTGVLTLNAAGNLILETGSNIQIEPPSTSTLTLQGNNIQIGDNLFVQSNGPIIFLAGQNLAVSGTNGTIRTINGDNINLVVDNNNPNSPNVGSGKFTLPAGYTICTNFCAGGPGKVLLYSSTPANNTFPTTLNTAPYTPGGFSGTTYNLGTNEFVGYWYLTLPPPDPPLFEVIFKSSGIVIPPAAAATVQTIQVAVTEPVSNPPQISQITEGNLQPPATPNPKTPCRTPPVAIQAL